MRYNSSDCLIEIFRYRKNTPLTKFSIISENLCAFRKAGYKLIQSLLTHSHYNLFNKEEELISRQAENFQMFSL